MGVSFLPYRGIMLVAVVCIVGCEPTKAGKVARNPKVVFTKPITDKVIDYQDFTGRLDAVKTVELRARVSGYVMEAKFKEGEVVKEGQVLFQIEAKPYQVEVNQMEADHKLAVADRNLMAKNADRARRLMATKSMSPEDYEKAIADLDKSAAQVGSVEAKKEKAQMYLDYTHVTAPFTGRISRRFVDPGNLIVADNTVLTTIVTEDPMFAYFDVDERTYLDLLASVAPGQKSWNEGLKLPVMMRLANENEFEKLGYVDFVDNRVAATTGTVRMRGKFENESRLLKAGLFVRIRLPIGSVYEAIIIPDEAIQSDQERKYVWIINAKNEVEYRSVKLGQSIKDLRVILAPTKGSEGKEGLTKEDRVIISGMQRVRSGIQVDAAEQASPTPPHMPLVRLVKKGG
jgi:multidrug efflux system membrane fusion protein